MPPPSLEYIHHSIDLEDVKYKNRNYFKGSGATTTLAYSVFDNETLCRQKAARAGLSVDKISISYLKYYTFFVVQIDFLRSPPGKKRGNRRCIGTDLRVGGCLRPPKSSPSC
jgi:hypothetical protein